MFSFFDLHRPALLSKKRSVILFSFAWETVEPELEKPVEERTRELESARAALRNTEQMLAIEIEAVQHLQQVAKQLMVAQGVEALYNEILDAALSILHADLASIQMVHPDRGATGRLKLLGHRGFSQGAAQRWEWVGPDSRTTCGEALRTGQRVLVSDVRACDFMAGSEDLAAFLDAGIHAAQTMPLTSRSGTLLGMLTTYWRKPHDLSVNEIRALDILARLAADLVERTQAEEVVRENQRLLTSIYDTVRDVIFDLAVEPNDQFRFVSVNSGFLRVTGLSREMVVGRTVNEVIPETSLAMVLGKYRQAIETKGAVVWEETSDYPTGRLTGEVSIVPIFNDSGTCTHLVGSVHDITERKRAEVMLRHKEQQLRLLAGSLFMSQEEERRRISREIHDDVTQRLAQLAMGLGAVAAEVSRLSEPLKERLRGLQRGIVEAAEATRHMAYQLYPAALDDLGLAAALRAYCEDFGRDGITVEFSSGDLPESVDREVGSCLYKVAQESLRNVAKHAKARRASVTLKGTGDRIILQIRDYGVGFPVEALAAVGGLGVVSMQERVRHVNGSFEIQSRPEQGTVITVEVPLPKVLDGPHRVVLGAPLGEN